MIRRITSLLFLFAFLLPAVSQDYQKILDGITREAYGNADKVLVFDSTLVEVQPSGLSYVNRHLLYKALTVKGTLDLSAVKFYYDPQSAWIEIREAIIHKKDGTTITLDSSFIYDYPQPARMIYWGAREKMIEAGRLEPGDALEIKMFRKGFTYALLMDQSDDERYIPPMKGHFYDIVEFWDNDPVVEKVYRVTIPADKTVQYKIYNGQMNSSATLNDGRMTYSFSKKDTRPIKREPQMVALSDVAPKLLLSTSPDWYAKSIWFYGVNEDYGSFEWTPEIKEKVDEILDGARDEMDSVSRLTHWVADEIRYSGISMGEGEGYTLHKGSMTFTDRCGVCKDKAGMLVTMLRAAGFESYAAMTMAGSRIDYIPADQFNHSVTVVKLSDGEYHLLDPTWVPFVRELWSSAEQQQQYLMGLPEGADLATTPISPAQKHFVRIFGTSHLDSLGTLAGEFTIRAEGQSDAAVRRMFTSNFKHLWEKALEDEIRNVHPSVTIREVVMDDPYIYMEGPIEISYEYEIPGYAVVTEEEVILRSFVASGIFKRALSHLYTDTHQEERKYPFRDRCSRFVKFNESIRLPGNYELAYYKVNEAFRDTAAYFEGSYEMDPAGTSLRMSMDVSLNKRVYDAEDWPAYRRAVEGHRTFMQEPVILRSK